MIQKKINFRTRKSGKSWLFATTLLAVVAGAGFATLNESVTAQADTAVTVSASGGNSLANVSTSSATETTSSSTVNVVATSKNVAGPSSTEASLSAISADQPTSPTTTSATTLNGATLDPSVPATTSESATSTVSTASTTPDSSSSSSSTTPSSATTSGSTSSQATGTPNAYAFDTTSPEDFEAISGMTYEVGAEFMAASNLNTPPLKAGDVFEVVPTGQQYQVLSAVDTGNPADGYPSNGMQAMAIAPIVNGQVDLSRIIISYAGSQGYDTGASLESGLNSDFPADWLTDFETIAGGSNTLALPFNSQVVPSQLVTAKEFASSVIAQYPNASYVITGFSLGGFLAIAVGAANQLPVYCYEGLEPINVLTSSESAYVKAHTNLYVDVTNVWDTVLGGAEGDSLGIRVYYDEGFTPDFLSAHMLNYTFDANGNISTPTASALGPMVNTAATSVDPVFNLVASLSTDALAGTDTTLMPLFNDIYGTVSPSLGDVPSTLNSASEGASSLVGNVFNAFMDYSWLNQLLSVQTKIISTASTSA